MKVVKTENCDIQIQIRPCQDLKNTYFAIKTEEGCWQEVVLPSEIVKEKFTDALLWKHILKFFIKE